MVSSFSLFRCRGYMKSLSLAATKGDKSHHKARANVESCLHLPEGWICLNQAWALLGTSSCIFLSSPVFQTEWHRRRGRQLLLAKVRMLLGRIGIFKLKTSILLSSSLCFCKNYQNCCFTLTLLRASISQCCSWSTNYAMISFKYYYMCIFTRKL